MRKVRIGWGNGCDTIIYSPTRNKFYSYEEDPQKIHELFGGECYYVSGSGLTGAGYITSGDFVLFGWYRIDAPLETYLAEPVYEEEKKIWGFSPRENHKGISSEYPVVLVSSNFEIAFVEHSEVLKAILDWNSLPWREKTLQLVTKDGYFDSKLIKVYDQFGTMKDFNLRMTRFIYHLLDCKFICKTRGESFLENKLHIIKTNEGKWVHYNVDYVFDAVIKDLYSDPLPEGWMHEEGVFYRRKLNTIYAFTEIKEEGESIEYEMEIPALKFFARKEEIIKKIKEKAVLKAMRLRIYSISPEEVERMMKENPEVLLTEEDSYRVGNCEIGTRKFMEKYKLSSPVKCGELLKHDSIKEMLEDPSFRCTIVYKVKSLQN